MDSEVERKWLSLCDQAKYVKGVSSPGNTVIPVWFDHDQFKMAQKYLKKNYPSVLLSVYNGLLFGMAHKGLAGPHLYRDSMSNISRFSRFFISINYYILIWLTEDPFDTSSKAYQMARNARSLHSHIAKKMNERDGRVEGRDVLWINQLEMILIMLRAIELAALFPDEYCNMGRESEDRQHMFHLFRVITYCMGLEDRFNVFGWPTHQLEQVIAIDFFGNIKPLIVNKQFLSAIKTQSLHQDWSGSKIFKLFFYLMKGEIFHLAKVLQPGNGYLDKKKKLGYNSYLYFKYIVFNKIMRIPIVSSYVTILLVRYMYRHKTEIGNMLI